MHLIVDCTDVGNRILLSSPERLKETMIEMAKVARMTMIGEPHIVACPFPAQNGATALSAVAFLGESAMTIHTYPEHSTIFMDIFHCLAFNVSMLFKWIVERFQMNPLYVTTFLFDRGVDRQGHPITTRAAPWVAQFGG